MSSKLHEENALKEELIRCLWKLVLSLAVESIDQPDRAREKSHYTSMNRLWTCS